MSRVPSDFLDDFGPVRTTGKAPLPPWYALPLSPAVVLILLIVLIGVFLLLAPDILEPGMREAARRSQCVNNLKQIALALHFYAEDHDGYFPPTCSVDASGRPLLSWRVLILPYIDQRELYARFHLDEPWYSPNNRELIAEMPYFYQCPSIDRRDDTTRYQVVTGPGTLFDGVPRRVLEEGADSTSETFLVVEASRPVVWTQPGDVAFRPGRPDGGLVDAFGSEHPGGANAALLDGSVRFIKSDVSPGVLRAIATRAGGEVVDMDWMEVRPR